MDVRLLFGGEGMLFLSGRPASRKKHLQDPADL